jgi:hypothetical protein
MILAWLLIITAGAGILAWIVGWWSERACRWVALLSLCLDLALLIFVWVSYGASGGALMDPPWSRSSIIHGSTARYSVHRRWMD